MSTKLDSTLIPRDAAGRFTKRKVDLQVLREEATSSSRWEVLSSFWDNIPYNFCLFTDKVVIELLCNPTNPFNRHMLQIARASGVDVDRIRDELHG